MTSIRRKRKCLTIGTQETRLLVWTAPESGTKKPPKAAVAADTPLMTGIGGRRRGGGVDWMGDEFLLIGLRNHSARWGR